VLRQLARPVAPQRRVETALQQVGHLLVEVAHAPRVRLHQHRRGRTQQARRRQEVLARQRGARPLQLLDRPLVVEAPLHRERPPLPQRAVLREERVDLPARHEEGILHPHALLETRHEVPVGDDDGVRPVVAHREGNGAHLWRDVQLGQQEPHELAIAVQAEQEVHLGATRAVAHPLQEVQIVAGAPAHGPALRA